MPRGDRTGPRGIGSRTGRAAGFCAGFAAPGYASAGGPGRGWGRGGGARCRPGWGLGFGLGRRNRYWTSSVPGWSGYGAYPPAYPQHGPEDERKALKYQADALRSELELINKRLSEMESSGSKE